MGNAPPSDDIPPELQLTDWRRRVFALYAAIRESADAAAAWRRWCHERDRLFAQHPQSPLPPDQRGSFGGLSYFDHDPRLRLTARVEPVEREDLVPPSSDGGSYGMTRFARAAFELYGRELSLDLFWLHGYAGGVFLPFADATSGRATYGAGRYLLDTVKGADLGLEDGALVVDLNFAYNPSCAYDPRWACPLTPPSNRLAVPVEGGERTP